MNRTALLFTLLFFLFCPVTLAQNGPQMKDLNIFAIVKDSKDSILEGYISAQPNEVMVYSKDNKEMKIPSKYIKSITLEKLTEVGSLNLDPKQEARYSVRLENSHEIYTLQKRYTFSLNTNVGVVTRSIDPEMINSMLSKNPSYSQKQKPVDDKSFIQDKSIIFSLEFRF
jgi:hypothetical protein